VPKMVDKATAITPALTMASWFALTGGLATCVMSPFARKVSHSYVHRFMVASPFAILMFCYRLPPTKRFLQFTWRMPLSYGYLTIRPLKLTFIVHNLINNWKGFAGELCDTCAVLPGCNHGSCNASFECNCNQGWTGLFCTQGRKQ